MKISIVDAIPEKVEVGKLRSGDTFEHCGHLYILTDETRCDSELHAGLLSCELSMVLVVRLSDGLIDRILPQVAVLPQTNLEVVRAKGGAK